MKMYKAAASSVYSCCLEFATQDILIISEIQFLTIHIAFHNNNLWRYCKYIPLLFPLFLLLQGYCEYTLISERQNVEYILFLVGYPVAKIGDMCFCYLIHLLS